MALISLLHPSRGRPDQAYKTYRAWESKSNLSTYDLDYVLSLDNSEPNKLAYINNNIDFIVNDNQSVVEATNHAAKVSKGDILIYLSDDFDCPENWGPLVLKEFEGVEGPCLLKVDDCLQPFNIRVLTIPIMNRALYERLGYFWNPDYKSMFVDQDLYEVCAKKGWLKFAPHLKFPHNHHSVGKAQNDETYKRSEANWNQGQEVFRRRQRQGFPI